MKQHSFNKSDFIKNVRVILLVAVVLVGVQYAHAAGWTPPAGTPPGNNTDAPINVGGIQQGKLGGLIVASGAGVNPGLLVENGNVGIGISNPAYKLDVNGDVRGSQVIGSTGLCIGSDCRSSWPAGGGGGGITSVNTMTGPAISIIGSGGTSVTNNGNVVTISSATTGGGTISLTSCQDMPFAPLTGLNGTWISCPAGKVMSAIKVLDPDTGPGTSYRTQQIKCCSLTIN